MCKPQSTPTALQAGITIRRALETDAFGVLECLRIAFEPYRVKYTPGAFADTVLTPETIQDRLGRMSVFVAVTADNPMVGTIAGAVVHAGEGHLRGMAVLPEWHGRGIAERLLQSEAELAARGCSRVTLDTTEPLQRAMRFYEKHGYLASGRTTDLFGMTLHEYGKDRRF
ncbi:MAG: GNAT family N-acetyltransferase [Candidatus Korobacteraceae bacterium]